MGKKKKNGESEKEYLGEIAFKLQECCFWSDNRDSFPKAMKSIVSVKTPASNVRNASEKAHFVSKVTFVVVCFSIAYMVFSRFALSLPLILFTCRL